MFFFSSFFCLTAAAFFLFFADFTLIPPIICFEMASHISHQAWSRSSRKEDGGQCLFVGFFVLNFTGPDESIPRRGVVRFSCLVDPI